MAEVEHHIMERWAGCHITLRQKHPFISCRKYYRSCWNCIYLAANSSHSYVSQFFRLWPCLGDLRFACLIHSLTDDSAQKYWVGMANFAHDTLMCSSTRRVHKSRENQPLITREHTWLNGKTRERLRAVNSWWPSPPWIHRFPLTLRLLSKVCQIVLFQGKSPRVFQIF